MGVHNLWELLSPAAQKINPESLRGKKLAIDTSIWYFIFLFIII